MYDVLAVSIKDQKVRILDTNKTKDAAEGVVMFAVMRRGVETEFYPIVEAGAYNEGDWYQGEKR